MDEAHMRRALDLAKRGTGLAPPNPLVGAILVRDSEAVGEGWHEGPGTPHAEMVALDAAGERAGGATMYVTLEPCVHQGRTPPCAPRVVAAGLRRVVVSTRDPNPLVDGRGIESLRSAGVEVAEGVLAEESSRLNEAFERHILTGLPLVTLKMAATLDGRAAAVDGSSKWITGSEARADVHRMRSAAGAVMVGAGTALRDDPTLTVRAPGYRGRPPLRVVVDARGVLPADRRVLTDGAAPTVLATTAEAPVDAREAWTARGAEVLVLGEGGTVPLDRLMVELGKRDVQHVLVEGGPTLAWSLAREDLVDRFVVYLAPRLLGGAAPSWLGGLGFGSLDRALDLEVEDVRRIGRDLRVEARVHRDR